MNKIDIKKTLVRAIVDISRDKEFYGHIIQQFQRVHVKNPHQISTAAVGRPPGSQFIKLYLNDDFFTDLIDTEVKKSMEGVSGSPMKARSVGEENGWNYVCGAMEHEIMHVALGHLFLKFDDNMRGNYACDCVVNSYLPKKCLHDSWIHPSRYDLPERKSAMWYYKELENNEKYKEDAARAKSNSLQDLIDVMSAHGLWDDVKDDEMAKEFIKDVIRKSKDLCNGEYGNVPGEIVSEIEGFLKPTKPIIPWTHVLRMFCAIATDSVLSYTQKRISKRFGTRPGSRLGDVLDLAIIVDTSGSMSDHDIKVLMNEVYWIWKNGAKVTVYQCDTHVHKPTKYRGKWDGKIHGRGGTYFDLALEAVEGKHDAAIYLTDGWAPEVKKRFRIPTLFVLTTDADNPYPWGRFVRIPQAALEAAS